MKQGHIKYIELHDGHVHIRARSTSFEKMDGITFKQFLDKAIELIVIEVLPNVRRSDLLRQVSTMLGLSYQQVIARAA